MPEVVYPQMLSMHCSFAEGIRSEWAIRNGNPNLPPAPVLANMIRVARQVYDPIYEATDGNVRVNSFYRNPVVNAGVGSKSPRSQHIFGEAMDLDGINGLSNQELLKIIKATISEYDQLISEYGTVTEPAWVHISMRETNNRRMFLRLP